MYCSKCGTQLTEGTPVCSNCGCPTEYYSQTVNLVNSKSDNAIKMGILLIIASICPIVIFLISKVIYGENSSYSNFIYQIPNLLYIAQSILILIFGSMNIKLESKIFRAAIIILMVSSVLLLVNDIQWMQEYSEDTNYLNLEVQYELFRIILFVGIGLLFLSLNRIITLTEAQKKMRIIGSILAFAYIPWLLFVELPYYSIESYLSDLEGILESFVWTFYGVYQPFIPLLENSVVRLTGSILLTIIAVMFYNTKKVEVNN